MEHSPCWDANSLSASQISCLLCDVNIHYHVHKNPPLDSVSNQMHPDKIMHLYKVK
jgi:hypothetical protein